MLMLILTSCQKKENTSESQLHLNFQEGEVPSLHPHILVNHMRGHSLGKLLFESLTRMDPEGNARPAGAKEIRVSQDATRFTFILRDHYWSDGSKVTAQHYASAWKHALSPGSACLRPDLFYVIKNGQKAKRREVSIEEAGIKAVDDSTLEVTLEYPCPHFLKLVAHPVFAPLINVDEEEPQIFNGSFIPHKWDKGVVLQLRPNSHFWNVKSIQLNQIDINCIDDPMTSMYMFEKGKIDWVGDTLSPVTREIAMSLIEDKKAICKPVNRFYWLHLNTTNPLLASAKIRRALSLSLEREEITKHICIGNPLSTPVHEQMICNLNEAVDVEDAKALFNEGLIELGYTKETCPSLTLNYARQKPLVEYLKNRWEEVLGLTIHLQRYDWNIFRSNLESGNYEIAGCLESAIYGDPIELLERFESLGNCNFSQWEDSRFKEILTRIKNETANDERMRLLSLAQKILIDEAPIIPIYRCIHVFSHHPKLKEYVIDDGGYIDFTYAHF